MKQIINWFFKPTTTKFKVVGWIIIAIFYVLVFYALISLGGCKSFEKTTGYKANESWETRKL